MQTDSISSDLHLPKGKLKLLQSFTVTVGHWPPPLEQLGIVFPLKLRSKTVVSENTDIAVP